MNFYPQMEEVNSEPLIPTMDQLSWLNLDWSSILERTQLHMSLLEPFIAFRRVLLQVLNCKDSMVQHLLQSTCTLRKGSRYSQAAAALHEFKFLCVESGEQDSSLYWLGRVEEAKLLRSQGQHEMAISLANSRTILEKYLKPAVSLVEDQKATDKRSRDRQSQTHFHLAHYADALFRSYEERLTSNYGVGSTYSTAKMFNKGKHSEQLNRVYKITEGKNILILQKVSQLQGERRTDLIEAAKPLRVYKITEGKNILILQKVLQLQGERRTDLIEAAKPLRCNFSKSTIVCMKGLEECKRYSYVSEFSRVYKITEGKNILILQKVLQLQGERRTDLIEAAKPLRVYKITEGKNILILQKVLQLQGERRTDLIEAAKPLRERRTDLIEAAKPLRERRTDLIDAAKPLRERRTDLIEVAKPLRVYKITEGKNILILQKVLQLQGERRTDLIEAAKPLSIIEAGYLDLELGKKKMDMRNTFSIQFHNCKGKGVLILLRQQNRLGQERRKVREIEILEKDLETLKEQIDKLNLQSFVACQIRERWREGEQRWWFRSSTQQSSEGRFYQHQKRVINTQWKTYLNQWTSLVIEEQQCHRLIGRTRDKHNTG
ncbi:hypothetical protein ACLB2K_020395 [Fragaria x ananassa]